MPHKENEKVSVLLFRKPSEWWKTTLSSWTWLYLDSELINKGIYLSTSSTVSRSTFTIFTVDNLHIIFL